MTDYRTQPINQKNADFVEQVADRIEEMQLEGRSLWQDAKRRFFRNKAAVASLIILAFIIVFITVAPWFFPFTYEDTDWNMMSSPPTMEGYHFFGTDASGRDLLIRTAIGGRISLLVGIAGAFISVTIGTIYGAISGYVGGKTDMLMMRFLEILSSFPFMFFVILLVLPNFLWETKGRRPRAPLSARGKRPCFSVSVFIIPHRYGNCKCRFLTVHGCGIFLPSLRLSSRRRRFPESYSCGDCFPSGCSGSRG